MSTSRKSEAHIFRCCLTAAAGLLSAWSFAVTAVAEDRCALDVVHPIVVPKNPRDKNDTVKHAYRLGDQSVVFLGRFDVDADGAPRAYGPNDSGLDFTRNAGSPGHWFGIATDAPGCGPKGRPLVQEANDPAPGFYVSTTAMTNPAVHDCRNPHNYVDASEIPYVALPPAISSVDAGGGSLVVIADGSNPQFALQADTAPAYGFGEGSIKLAQALGLNPNPRNGGVHERRFVYLVLRERGGFPASGNDVQATARAAFEAWGGVGRLQLCATAVRTAPP